jgi:long-chain acyl-CoA synthetase
MRIEDLLTTANPHHTSSIVDDRGMHSFAELQQRAMWLQDALRACGVRRGDRVVLVADNGLEFVATVFGILAAGAAVVPIDPALPYDSVAGALGSIDPTCVCIAGRRSGEWVSDLCRDGARRRLLRLEDVSGRPVTAPAQPSSLSDGDPAFVLFSSGTTGRAKGIVLSHRAILENTASIADYLRPSQTDQLYIAKSMTHCSSITGEILVAISCGAGIVATNPAVHPGQMFRNVAEHRPSIMCIPTSLLHFFGGLRAGPALLGSLHTIHFSGAIVHSRTVRAVAGRLPWIRLINGYGLTEGGPRIAQSGPLTVQKPGTIGRPIRGVSLDVRRNGRGRCAPHEIGELYVRSPALMEGYLNDDALTATKLRAGWLATGDVGYVDEDGDFFVVGRNDDLIVTGSHNVAPRDVEEVVLQLPAVEDCVVFGVADALLGQRVVCIYSTSVPRDDRHGMGDTLRRWCAAKLASYQVPKHFYEWEAIPDDPGGKKRRALTRARFLAQKAHA